jgi:phage terminase large subunit
MGAAENEKDIEKFQTFEFNLAMFDELVEWTKKQFDYVWMRNRTKSDDLPIYMRNATNPGGEGQEWVDQRYIKTLPNGGQTYQPWRIYTHKVHIEGLGDEEITRQFMPSTIFDNPKASGVKEYMISLADLPDDMKQAFMYGRWNVVPEQFFPKVPRSVPPGFKNHEHGRWYIIRCCDYGYHDPCALYYIVVYPWSKTEKKPVLEICYELYADHLHTDDIVQQARNEQRNLHFQDHDVQLSVMSPDAFGPRGQSGTDISRDLLNQGLWFEKANTDRVQGWAAVLRLIARDQLRMWQDHAPNLARTLPRLQRHPDKATDVRHKGVEDHGPEAIRYGCMAFIEQPEKVLRKAVVRPENQDPYWEGLQAHLRSGDWRRDDEGFGSGF